jgi:hypothetical protein
MSDPFLSPTSPLASPNKPDFQSPVSPSFTDYEKEEFIPGSRGTTLNGSNLSPNGNGTSLNRTSTTISRAPSIKRSIHQIQTQVHSQSAPFPAPPVPRREHDPEMYDFDFADYGEGGEDRASPPYEAEKKPSRPNSAYESSLRPTSFHAPGQSGHWYNNTPPPPMPTLPTPVSAPRGPLIYQTPNHNSSSVAFGVINWSGSSNDHSTAHHGSMHNSTAHLMDGERERTYYRPPSATAMVAMDNIIPPSRKSSSIRTRSPYLHTNGHPRQIQVGRRPSAQGLHPYVSPLSSDGEV